MVFTCFHVDMDAIKEALIGILANKEKSYQLITDFLSLDRVDFGSPNRGGRLKKCAAIYSPTTSPSDCVFIANSSDGWFTLVNALCSELAAHCISVSTTDDDVEHPINMVRVYEQGRESRCVRAMLDGDRWEFFEKGNVQSFESVANYQKRRIRDRLRRADVVEYLRLAGIDILSAGFWETKTPALYISEQ